MKTSRNFLRKNYAKLSFLGILLLSGLAISHEKHWEGESSFQNGKYWELESATSGLSQEVLQMQDGGAELLLMGETTVAELPASSFEEASSIEQATLSTDYVLPTQAELAQAIADAGTDSDYRGQSFITTGTVAEPDYYFYKINNTSKEAVRWVDGEITEWSDKNYIYNANIKLDDGENHTVYIVPTDPNTPAQSVVSFLEGTKYAIVDGMNYNGKQSSIIQETGITTVYFKGTNKAVSAAYAYDVKNTETSNPLPHSIFEAYYDESDDYVEESSATFVATGSGLPGIRVNAGGTLTINSGNITAIGTDTGIGHSTGGNNGEIYINGGTVYAQGKVGIGAGALKSGCDITINGGTVTAVGTSIGIGSYGVSSSNTAGNVVFNGGEVFAYGGTVAIQTYREGNVYLNGGVVTAYTGGTASIGYVRVTNQGVTQYNTASFIASPYKAGVHNDNDATGGILFYNGTIAMTSSTMDDMIAFVINDDGMDPYHNYYSNSISSSTVSQGDESSTNTWYGRVYGKVELQSDFTIGATELYKPNYDTSLHKIDKTAVPLASCDAMLLDIPQDRDTVNLFHTHADEAKQVNYLTIEEGSRVRFLAQAVKEPATSANGVWTKDTLNLGGWTTAALTAIDEAYEEAPFQWKEDTMPPSGNGTIEVVLTDDVIWNSASYMFTQPEADLITVVDGKAVYNGLAKSHQGYVFKPNGAIGYTYVVEAGTGNFWNTAVASMSYRGVNASKGLGAGDIAWVDTYTVALQGSGERKWFADTQEIYKPSTDADKYKDGVFIEFTNTVYNAFTVEPFNLGKQEGDEWVTDLEGYHFYHYDNVPLDPDKLGTDGYTPPVLVPKGHHLTVTVATSSVTDGVISTDVLQIDAAGQLNVEDSDEITVNSPFVASTPLEYGTDYMLSFVDATPTQQALADNQYSIHLVVEGLGNYTGSYTDTDNTYILEKSSGTLGGVSIEVNLGGSGTDTNSIFVKPDGEADFSVLKITSMNGETIYYDGKKPDQNVVLDAVAVNQNGSLYYNITVSIKSGAELGDTGFTDANDTLTFSVLAEEAGSGSSFDTGSLHLVTPFYQRPDCQLHPSDLVLMETQTKTDSATGEKTSEVVTLTLNVDYLLQYYDGSKWVDWHAPVDCETISSRNDCDVKPNTGGGAEVAAHFSDEFLVRAIRAKNGNVVTTIDETSQETVYAEELEFNVIWSTGGSVAGRDFGSGILYTYQAESPTIYVAKDYGLLFSAEKLELWAKTEVLDETKAIAVPMTDESGGLGDADGGTSTLKYQDVLLTDNDIANATRLDDFTQYITQVVGNDMLIDYNKSYIFWVEGNVSSLSLEGDKSFTYFTDNYIDEKGNPKVNSNVTWYLYLAGSGSFTGSTLFEIPASSIKFMDIMEDVVGVLDDLLILDPNSDYYDHEIYVKPDGTLHETDLKMFQYRTPAMSGTGSEDFFTHTVGSSTYSVEASANKFMTEDGDTDCPLTELEESLKGSLAEDGSESIYYLKLTNDSGVLIDAKTVTRVYNVPMVVNNAGTGDSFRHGSIDLVEKQTIPYVAPSGVDENDALYYTSDDYVRMFKNMSFTENGATLVYESDFTASMTAELFEDNTAKAGGEDNTTQTLNITLYNTDGSGDAVTFQITVEMEEDETVELVYYANNLESNATYTQAMYMSESFAIWDNLTNSFTYDYHTFIGWSFDPDGEKMLDATVVAGLGNYNDLVYYQNNYELYHPATDSNISALSIVEEAQNQIRLYAQWKAIENGEIVYFSNDGTGTETKGDRKILTDSFTLHNGTGYTRVGYTWAGWSFTQGGTAITASYSTMGDLVTAAAGCTTSSDNVNHKVSLFAVWEPNEYTVIFDDDITDSSYSKKTSKEYNSLVPFPDTDPTKVGYNFLGWSADKTTLIAPGVKTFHELTSKVNDGEYSGTLYAVWEPMESYHIYFSLNYAGGGLLDFVVSEFEDKFENDDFETTAFALPATDPTREGYDFLGWSPDVSGGSILQDVTSSQQGTEASEPSTEDDVISQEDSTDSNQDSTEAEDNTDSTPTEESTESTDEDEGTQELESRSLWARSSVSPVDATYGELTFETYSTENVENVAFVYGQWAEKEYTVDFDFDGGVSAAQVTTLGSYDSSKIVRWLEAIPLPSLTKDDHFFVAWKYGDDIVSEGMSVSQLLSDDDNSQEIVLTAIWQENPALVEDVTYTVSFYGEDDVLLHKESSIVSSSLVNFPKAPEKEGYTFLGWGTSKDATIYVNAGTFVGLTKEITDSIHFEGKFYPVWEEIEELEQVYTVSFDSAGGTSASDKSVTYEENFILPTVSRSGYSFQSWTYNGTNVSGSTSLSQLAVDTSVEGIELVATWSRNSVDSGDDEQNDFIPPDNNNSTGGSSSGGSSSGGSSSGGSSSGGSSSGGSSSSSSNINTHTGSNSTTVEITLSSSTVNGNQAVTVDTSEMESLISAGGDEFHDIVITGNFSSSTSSTASDFIITKDALELFLNSQAESLSVQKDGTLLTFDADAVSFILENTMSETVISMDSLAQLSEEAQNAFGNRTLLNFSLTSDQGNTISKLEQGLMKITFPCLNLDGNVLGGQLMADGSVVYEPKSYYTGSELLVMLDSFGTYGIATRDNNGFLQAFEPYWSLPYVAFTDARRLYESLGEITPEQTINRGMFVEILGKLEQLDSDEMADCTQFGDVDASASYSPYVQWAFENRIVGGTSPDTFEPEANISREEMAVMLVAYINGLSTKLNEPVEPKVFDDEYISDWAVESVDQAQAYGLISGKDDNMFDALGWTTYGEHAVMIMTFLENLLSAHTVHLD